MSKAVEFKITDNSGIVLNEFEKKVELALEAVGAAAQGYAAQYVPVDTGRLRNSITWATRQKQGAANTYPKGYAQPSDYKPLATPESAAVYIGTNVEYAAAVEYRDYVSHVTGGAHYLKNAVANHGDTYKQISEAILKDT